MRRAFIGVSSPIAYDASNCFHVGYLDVPKEVRERCHVSYNGLPYPTPILEASYGLMLFFDELWFLSRALCPPNLQGLPFVHYVIESEYVSEIESSYISSDQIAHAYYGEGAKDRIEMALMHSVQSAEEDLTLSWNADLRDRSEIFGWGSGPLHFGSVGSISHVLSDLNYISQLSLPNMELITNRFSTPIVESLTNRTSMLEFGRTAEELCFHTVPDYLSPEGPFHPSILDARNDPYLKDFRNWVTRASELSPPELAELAHDTQRAISRLHDHLIDEYFGESNIKGALTKTVIGKGIDLLLPGLFDAIDLARDWITQRNRRRIRHQAFLLRACLKR